MFDAAYPKQRMRAVRPMQRAMAFVQASVNWSITGGVRKRLKAVLDFGEDGMSVPMSNIDVDDVNVFERRFKDTRTELDAVAGKFGKHLIRRHVPRRNVESDIGASRTYVSCSVEVVRGPVSCSVIGA